MKKLFLFFSLCFLLFGFNACSSDDDEQKPPSNSLKECDMLIWLDQDYDTTFKIVSGSYNKSTQTLNLKAEDNTEFIFIIEFEEDSSRIKTIVFNGVHYTIAPTYSFYYAESKGDKQSYEPYSYYGIYTGRNTLRNGLNSITLQGHISFYQ